MRIDIPTRLGRPCAYPHIHVCMKSYVCQFIFSWILDGCRHTRMICMKSYLCEFYIPTRLGWLCAYLDTDVYTIRYVLIYIFMGLGQLCGCPDTYVWNHLCANLYSHTSWTAVCTLGVSQSCDLQFCTHVCSHTSQTALIRPPAPWTLKTP